MLDRINRALGGGIVGTAKKIVEQGWQRSVLDGRSKQEHDEMLEHATMDSTWNGADYYLYHHGKNFPQHKQYELIVEAALNTVMDYKSYANDKLNNKIKSALSEAIYNRIYKNRTDMMIGGEWNHKEFSIANITEIFRDTLQAYPHVLRSEFRADAKATAALPTSSSTALATAAFRVATPFTPPIAAVPFAMIEPSAPPEEMKSPMIPLTTDDATIVVRSVTPSAPVVEGVVNNAEFAEPVSMKGVPTPNMDDNEEHNLHVEGADNNGDMDNNNHEANLAVAVAALPTPPATPVSMMFLPAPTRSKAAPAKVAVLAAVQGVP